jgi:type IV pilus assembly protein PilM
MTLIPKRRRKTVGIEFSNRGLHMSVASANGETIDVLTVDDVSFGDEVNEVVVPPSAMEPVKAFVKLHRLRGMNAVVSVSNPRSVVRCVKMPMIPEKALRPSVEVSMGTTIHLPFEDPVFDVAPLASIPGTEEQFVCIVATPREIVNEMSDFVRNVGLHPVAVEIPPLALWRLFVRDHDASGLSLLVDLDESEACFSLFIDDKLYFSRCIQMTMQTVVGQLDVVSLVNDLAYEVDRIVKFFQYNLSTGTETLERIVLHSKVGHSERIASLLGNRMNLSAVVLQPQIRSKRSEREVDSRFYTAIGLAIRERF